MPKGLYFTAAFSFFLFFSTPNLRGHWTDPNQTWTHIHLWLLLEKFALNSPGIYPQGLEAKKTLFWDRLCPNISLQRNMISTIEKKLVNLQGLPYIHDTSQLGELWSRNGWERLASFCPPPKFAHLETLPSVPHGRYIAHSSQALARVM